LRNSEPPDALTPLDTKINQHFAGLVAPKDLTKTVKGNAIVPSYVLEYLLGQHCATDDVASIQSGIETVKNILANGVIRTPISPSVTVRSCGP
jgi:predicted ATP-dependent Lon-type protease